jgi:TatD DNase family protein
MLLVDVHAHMEHYENVQEVLSKCEDVKVIIASGIDYESNRKVLQMASEFSQIKASIGIYPVEVLKEEKKLCGEKFVEFDVDSEIEFIKKHKDEIIAIGEIGMDDYHLPDRLEEQEKHFRRMLDLAKELNKPVIIHSRKAEERVISILEEYDLKVLMHCFGGKKALVRRCVENGWSFSIPANVCRSDGFQMIVKLCPMHQLMTETDSPLMSPVKETVNYPCNVSYGVKEIAKIKDLDVNEVANMIFMNYQKFFS